MADKISDMTTRTEIFATEKSSDFGEATSSKHQLLLDRIKSFEEQLCQISVFSTNQELKIVIVFVLYPDIVLGNVSTPKENIAIFTSIFYFLECESHAEGVFDNYLAEYEWRCLHNHSLKHETFKTFLKSAATLYPPLGKDQQ
ncbi:hypothetical protein TNCV_5016361 [Trichonephila clavipes]|nr:hypothetical protein TNCV_5016361 [Trichonephila clavipes]